MRPEIRERLLALRDVLPRRDEVDDWSVLSVTAARVEAGGDLLCMTRRACPALTGALRALLRALPRHELGALDEDVEQLGGLLSEHVSLSTPWRWSLWRPGDARTRMLLTTKGSPREAEGGGVALMVDAPLTLDRVERLNAQLYPLFAALLGAEEAGS